MSILPLVLAMTEVIPPGSELAIFVNTYLGWVLALVGPGAIALAIVGLLRGRANQSLERSKVLLGLEFCWN
jgi:hypothetical protein